MDNISVSEHARKRYAERIMGLEKKADVIEYTANNEEKIVFDIHKMVEFGAVCYHGATKNQKIVNVVINGTWIILLSDDRTVITLYKKDLGIDDEDFNKAYMLKILHKLKELQVKYDLAEEKVLSEALEYESKMRCNAEQIDFFRSEVSKLEELNKGYKQVLDNIQSEVAASRHEVHDFVNRVIGKRVF